MAELTPERLAEMREDIARAICDTFPGVHMVATWDDLGEESRGEYWQAAEAVLEAIRPHIDAQDAEIERLTTRVAQLEESHDWWRTEANRQRREREVLAAAIEARGRFAAHLLACGACRPIDPCSTGRDLEDEWLVAQDEALALLDRQQGDEHTTTYRQMDECSDGWECTAPGCDMAWSLTDGEPPSRHNMRYCPGCGRRIVGEEPWRVDGQEGGDRRG